MLLFTAVSSKEEISSTGRGTSSMPNLDKVSAKNVFMSVRYWHCTPHSSRIKSQRKTQYEAFNRLKVLFLKVCKDFVSAHYAYTLYAFPLLKVFCCGIMAKGWVKVCVNKTLIICIIAAPSEASE